MYLILYVVYLYAIVHFCETNKYYYYYCILIGMLQGETVLPDTQRATIYVAQ